MAEWIEQIESRAIQSAGGRGSGTRTFMADGYTSVKAVFESFGTGVGTAGVPQKGSSHPDFPGMIAKDFSITPVSGHTTLFKVEWKYEMVSTDYFSAPTFDVPEQMPQEVGYTELSSEIRTEFALAWRNNPNVPAGGEPALDDDIGGTPVDVGGIATSIIRRKQELVLTETVNVPNYGQISSYSFQRNSRPFLGAARGRVMYRGASIRRSGLNVYTVAHSFVDDQYSHCEQQPLIDQNGMVHDLDKDGHADEVYFIQPFTSLIDFNNLSNNF